MEHWNRMNPINIENLCRRCDHLYMAAHAEGLADAMENPALRNYWLEKHREHMTEVTTVCNCDR